MKSTLLPLEPFQVFNSILEMGGKETISHAYFLLWCFAIALTSLHSLCNLNGC
jgi:hypothetical protein